MKQSTFFTFGSDSPYAGKYVEVQHEKYDDPRSVMMGAHSRIWGFQYDELQFAGKPAEFGLVRLALISRNRHGHFEAEPHRDR